LDEPRRLIMAGLLDDAFTNPALQFGLGILANNQGNYGSFGAALGKGGLQGINNLQRAKMMQMQQMEYDQQRKERERIANQNSAQEQSHADFDTKFPQYKGLSRLDPKSALKIAYPDISTNQADPYFTPIATERGLGSYNNRTGEFMPLNVGGNPIVKSTDSPLVRGGVREAEARATAGYNINNDIPGVVTTSRQIAEQVNPALGMRIPQNVQRGRDDTRMKILLDEQSRGGGAGVNPELDKEINLMRGRGFGGIPVPTPEQQAGLTEQAKLSAEAQTKSKMNLPNVIQEGENTVNLVDDLLKSKGFKQAVGASRLLGIQNIPGTSAKDFDVRLDQLKGKQFLQAYESLKGAGAITDIEGTKAGNAISRMDASQSEEEFQKAAREFQQVIKNGVERAKNKAGGIMPGNEQMPKTVVKRGRYNGRTVLKYSDGSVEYGD